MTKIVDLARTVRSKNAGPFQITIDMFFADQSKYNVAKNSGKLNESSIAKLYGIDIDDVIGIYKIDDMMTIKVSMKRKIPSGHHRDSDIYSAQQHSPLLEFEL